MATISGLVTAVPPISISSPIASRGRRCRPQRELLAALAEVPYGAHAVLEVLRDEPDVDRIGNDQSREHGQRQDTQNHTLDTSVVPWTWVRRITITGTMPAITQFIETHSATTVDFTATT